MARPVICPYLDELCRRVRHVAGDRLDGVWLVGSTALGDFDPARSDLDVQAIAGAPLARDELTEIAALLDHGALPCPARGLEFVLYPRAGLADPAGPAFALNLDTGARVERHLALRPDEDPRFWFTLDVAIARQAGVALTGPPAAEAFPELPRALVLAAAGEALRWHARHDATGVATVLGACRTLAWLDDGRWRSKGDSAARMRAALPDPGVADRALALRDGGAAAALGAREVDAVVGATLTALEAAGREG